MNIELHIDELILEGLPQAQREQIAAQIEQALAALVAEQGLPPAWQQGGGLESLTQQIQPGSRPEVIGQQVARSILGGMGGAPQPPNPTGMSALKGSVA